MRLLHTADWHVGKTIRGRARTDEFEAALAQVVRIAIDERVDCVLVAGDLYEQRAATPEADRLIFQALLELYGARIPVVAIPGNHDSPLRFQALAPLLATIDVHLVPEVARPDDGGVVEVAARDGSHGAVIAGVPFVPERRLAGAAEAFVEAGRTYQSYADGLTDVLATMTMAFRDDSVNVLMGHLFVDGARPGGGEREITLGGAYTIPPSALPPTASYIALGHVHKPQEVRGARSPARYAGSLIQLDFGEREQKKSVYLVDAIPGKPAHVQAIALDAGRKLLDVAGTLDDLPTIAERVGDAFLRVTLKVDGVVPGLADRVRATLPNALDVTLDYERIEVSPQASLRSLLPRDQFSSYYQSAHATEPAAELLTAFDRVYDEVTG